MSDEEITRDWVKTGRISIPDFAQLKAGCLASLDNPPDCTTCPAFEHEVQHYHQFKYRISTPSPTMNIRHLKYIILGGILMLPGADYGIVNEGVESRNSKVLTNELAEEILAMYPSYSTILVPNPDYDPEAESERIELERVEAEERAQAQADADQAAQDEADRLADEHALLTQSLAQSLPITGIPRTDATAGTSTTGTQQVATEDHLDTAATAGTSSTGVTSVNADEQPGALATDPEGQVSGQASAQTTDTLPSNEPLVNQMQLNLGDTATGTAATNDASTAPATGATATAESIADAEKKS